MQAKGDRHHLKGHVPAICHTDSNQFESVGHAAQLSPGDSISDKMGSSQKGTRPITCADLYKRAIVCFFNELSK